MKKVVPPIANRNIKSAHDPNTSLSCEKTGVSSRQFRLSAWHHDIDAQPPSGNRSEAPMHELCEVEQSRVPGKTTFNNDVGSQKARPCFCSSSHITEL